ncbi:hypothetical protein CBM2633_P30025 [Cupriavidus taiwanensis]|uniref:Uncharacterized protein n=2 Tax=Cupriavidus TaxID=106589 RepID=A0A375CN64_9BURK|nr:hypothetical protein CBM2588_P30023 [Cupriavidus taiwanensis]SOZ40594.1 hypothetical protein CBM2605_P30024 [Cupriavidus neocaledonicus]SOY75464.1 hypothetical protein CBM2592_P30024 [Cupriavidus taiwanensis]SOY75762.1 hypothetical protein CBM2585_P30024 [Cupriavidus taiwanensis]SOY76313.1 hypothetical protein CBM2589_P30023 [Cupriavidus taiwanensis]
MGEATEADRCVPDDRVENRYLAYPRWAVHPYLDSVYRDVLHRGRVSRYSVGRIRNRLEDVSR